MENCRVQHAKLQPHNTPFWFLVTLGHLGGTLSTLTQVRDLHFCLKLTQFLGKVYSNELERLSTNTLFQEFLGINLCTVYVCLGQSWLAAFQKPPEAGPGRSFYPVLKRPWHFLGTQTALLATLNTGAKTERHCIFFFFFFFGFHWLMHTFPLSWW